jgi:vacuolar-type H+-ATPase subunit I/STV1
MFGLFNRNKDATANEDLSTSSRPLGGVPLPKGMSLPSTERLRSIVSEHVDTRVSNVKDKVNDMRDDLQTHQELPSRVDGLQVKVTALQQQVADLTTNFNKVLSALKMSSQTDDYNKSLDDFKQRLANQVKTITIM